MSCMWAVSVVPIQVRVETPLDCLRAQWHDRPTHPRLHVLEHPLDLRVELPRTDLAADVRSVFEGNLPVGRDLEHYGVNAVTD